MKNGGNGNGSPGARFNYPRTKSELDAQNSRSHLPFGNKMLPQTEAGASAIAKAHGSVSDVGMLTRDKALPGGTDNTPLTGSVDCGYESYPCLNK